MRRNFLAKSGLIVSGAAITLLEGNDPLAAKGGKLTEQDIRILNTAIGAESGLLEKPVLARAVTFQGHHTEHAEILSKTIVKRGGKPALAKAKYNFPTEKLKTQADVLQFAASLEKAAGNYRCIAGSCHRIASLDVPVEHIEKQQRRGARL